MLATQTNGTARQSSARAEQLDDRRRLQANDRALIDRATRGFELLQGKWKLDLIVAMARGIRRHSRLQACLPGISKKVMTDCLRGLERDGLVTRQIYAQVPVRVEYSLTPLGWALTDLIVALSDWTTTHSSDLTQARNEYWLRQTEVDGVHPAIRSA